MRRRKKANSRLITHDFILQLYKDCKKMEPQEQEKVIEKLKEMTNYIGQEICFEV